MLVTQGTFAAQMVESLEADVAESNDAIKDSKKKKHRKGPSRDIKLIWANNRRRYNHQTNNLCPTTYTQSLCDIQNGGQWQRPRDMLLNILQIMDYFVM